LKKYLSEFPDLVKEWNSEKNDSLKPEQFTHGNHKKVWWICKKGHEWESAIYSRTNKRHQNGCPYCSGNRVSSENNLQTRFPEIAKDWHPTKNGSKSPSDYTSGSGEKIWWICSKGHEWKVGIQSRTEKRKSGCPYCSGNRVSPENNLLVKYPEIAKDWHPTKNGSKSPSDYPSGSSKKVWWICSKGHEWKTTILTRTGKSKSGCPYCSGNLATLENNLQVLHPEIVIEWDHKKNNGSKPIEYSPQSSKKVWWICSKGHEWKTAISSRTGKSKSGCPYCSGRRKSL